MNSITVFSTASDRHVVEAYHIAMDSLIMQGVVVNHVGLASDLWYAGNAGDTYRFHGYESRNLPRIPEAAKPWWHTEDPRQELRQSLPSIGALVRELIDEYSPDVFLLADDTGPLEVFLIETFRQRQIPVVLLQHGYGVGSVRRRKLQERLRNCVEQAYCYIRSMIASLRSQKRRTVPGSTSEDSEEVLPEVNPFGLNGDYLICSYADLTKRELIKRGVKPEQIRDTGYPYFDRLVQAREVQDKRRNRPSRVLVVSTGWGKFGRVERAKEFYSFVVDMCRLLQDSFETWVRPKPGEDTSLFLSQDVRQEMLRLGVKYDDNTIPSYSAVANYDLVIGEASTVLLESAILSVPAMLIHTSSSPPRNPRSNMDLILENILGMLTATDVTEVPNAVHQALSSAYVEALCRRLKQNERDLFHHLDGKAGKRVGQVLLEAASEKSG